MSVRGRAFQIRRHIVRRKRGGKEKRKNGKAGGGQGICTCFYLAQIFCELDCLQSVSLSFFSFLVSR